MRLEVRGKFLFFGENKFYPKGMTVAGSVESYPGLTELGLNTIWLENPTAQRVEEFAERGFKIILRLGFDKTLTALFGGDGYALLRWREETSRLIKAIRDKDCVIAYDLGGPLQDPVRRWLGARAVLHHFRDAYEIVKIADDSRLVTATCESRNPAPRFLDFFSFQVNESSLSEYRRALGRLQIEAGDRPLLVSVPGLELGAGSEDDQAHTMDQQVRMAFITGCAGFGLDLWQDSQQKLGLFTLDGTKKRSFDAVRTALEDSPFPNKWISYPRISVVVCVYNGERDIDECLDQAARIDYPNFEVIIVNDGSTDSTLKRAEEKAYKYGFRVISHFPNRGLSAARNRGMEEATGEIIVYLDSDAFPDRDWLKYLAITFLSTKHAIIGGPNINPLSVGPIVDCIDQAPGNPQIVMIQDEMADHIPGCNLAVRRQFMESVGGFDAHYKGGGDDVNFCWKVARFGGTMGASPGAVVWHYRRPTIKAYLRQQIGYGKGEAALEPDWPERFNSLGHQVGPKSGPGLNLAPRSQARPRIYERSLMSNSWLPIYPAMPEWPMLFAVFVAVSLLGFFWTEFFVFAPIAFFGLIGWVIYALNGARRARLREPSLRSRAIVAYLYLAQPVVRLYGRLVNGMTPWRSRCRNGFVFPLPKVLRIQNRDGLSLHTCVEIFDKALRRKPLPAVRGAEALNWDWQMEGGIFAGARVLMNATEADIVLRVRPYVTRAAFFLGALLLTVGWVAFVAQAWLVLMLLIIPVYFLAERVVCQAGEAVSALNPILADESIWRLGLWERFQPPRHFFVELTLPKNDTPVSGQNVALEDKVSL